MAFKLQPKVRRVRDFNGVRIATTGLPMTYAAEVAALAGASQEQHTQWLSTRFLEALPKCVFVTTDETPIGEPVEGDLLDLESLSDLFMWVCGFEGTSPCPLSESAAEPPAASLPSVNSSESTPTP